MMDKGRKAVGAAALSVSVVWFLVFVSLAAADWNDRRNVITAIPSIRSGERERHDIHHKNININCVSKRRVPNGPDPIHNRRAGVTQLPPT